FGVHHQNSCQSESVPKASPEAEDIKGGNSGSQGAPHADDVITVHHFDMQPTYTAPIRQVRIDVLPVVAAEPQLVRFKYQSEFRQVGEKVPRPSDKPHELRA
ncbi:hypothetical protein AURDEDRAFT_112834, partial [Auricularia subglabra TFB-10046 SS5]